jgi:nucleoid DNA-binding protein
MNTNEYFLKDLKRDVANALGYTQADVENILRTAFDIIGDKVAIEGKKVYLIDFVNLEPKDYGEKRVKNPQTEEPMIIPPYRTIICQPTKEMKRKLKKGIALRE